MAIITAGYVVMILLSSNFSFAVCRELVESTKGGHSYGDISDWFLKW